MIPAWNMRDFPWIRANCVSLFLYSTLRNRTTVYQISIGTKAQMSENSLHKKALKRDLAALSIAILLFAIIVITTGYGWWGHTGGIVTPA